jgi:hypothetical protein
LIIAVNLITPRTPVIIGVLNAATVANIPDGPVYRIIAKTQATSITDKVYRTLCSNSNIFRGFRSVNIRTQEKEHPSPFFRLVFYHFSYSFG